MSGHFALSRVMFPCSVLCVLHDVYVVVVMCIYYWLQTKLPHGDMKAFPYLTLLINTFKKQKQVQLIKIMKSFDHTSVNSCIRIIDNFV